MAKQTVEQNGSTGIFTTVEEARAAKPEKHAKWKVWKVTGPNGGERFVWGDGLGHALRQIALADGYKAANLDSKPANPQMVAGLLAALTESDRAALIAQYVKVNKAK
jgi:hypothetical protein